MRFDLPYVKIVKQDKSGAISTVRSGIHMQEAVEYVKWLQATIPGNYKIVSQKNGTPVDEFGKEL